MINKEYVYTLAWGGHEGSGIHFLSSKKKYSEKEYKKLISDLYVKIFSESDLKYSFTGTDLMNYSIAMNDIAREFRDDEHHIDDDPKDYFAQILKELNTLGFTLLLPQEKFVVGEMEHILSLPPSAPGNPGQPSEEDLISNALFEKYPELKKWKELPRVEFREEEPTDSQYGGKVIQVSETLSRTEYSDGSGSWYYQLDKKNWAKFDLHNIPDWRHEKSEANRITIEQAEELGSKIKDWWIHSRKSVDLVEEGKNEKV